MNLENIINQVISLAKEAGIFIKNERENFDSSKIEMKGHSANLVSYVDKETEKILVTGLKKIIPEAGFITEEGTVSQHTTEDFCWLIDPLDGTTNFLHNVPIYSTSIALMKGDKIIAGVVYDMNQNECFYAWEGGGAWCNGKKIASSAPKNLSESLIATGFPYFMFDKYREYMNVLEDLMKSSHGLRRCGSAAIDMCWVAAGRFDGYFEYNINSYDIAAGCIILQESGGKVSDFRGGKDYIFGKNIVAASATIHEDFKEIVKKNFFPKM
jgi:myo-inositol-1(or 4)-monophosphatase